MQLQSKLGINYSIFLVIFWELEELADCCKVVAPTVTSVKSSNITQFNETLSNSVFVLLWSYMDSGVM